jgi:hypothetical protein
MNMKTIKLRSDELWPLLNILNEICHGIHIENFEQNIGERKKNVIDLMNRISKEEEKEEIIIKLNDSELDILKRSFAEVFKQIGEWEFQTRIGITIKEALKIQNKLIKNQGSID